MSTGSSLISFDPSKDKKLISSHFKIQHFYNISIFTERLQEVGLDLDSVYTVYIKVRYRKDSYFMLGNQFGLKYSSEMDFEDTFKVIKARLAVYYERYHLTDADIVFLQVNCRLLDKKIYSDLLIDDEKFEFITPTEKKNTVNLVIIPTASKEEDSLGKCLPVVLDTNNNIKVVDIVIKNIKYNFLDIIVEKTKYIKKNHRDSITSFDKDYKFLHIKAEMDYVLVVKELESNKVDKLKYSMGGILLERVTDTFVGNSIIRKKGLEYMYIENNNEVTKLTNTIKFNAIEKYVIKKSSWLPNPNIGVIDTEVYLNKDKNLMEIYALGFRTNLLDYPVTYYIDSDYDSVSLVLKMIDELLRPKYNNITFYCHNSGKYDAIFLIGVLTKYNVENPENKYDLDPIFRDKTVLKLTIKKNGNSLTIVDSITILTGGLAKLAKDFGVETQKSIFPHKFSVQGHLFYEGHTPGIHFYNDLSIKEYSEIYKENWSFKRETISYLRKDLSCLYEVMVCANKQVFDDYKINITEAYTISGLAIKLFLNKYYNDNIPLINKPSIYKDIKQAYYGGITEVYKPFGENLFYYDVNSLYPFTALNDMPGLWCDKITYYKDNPYISELFGFFYCEIESPLDLYLGLLPVRVDLGIEFPLGKWRGWYFSEELKFAIENGYKIKVLKGSNFSRVNNVFTSYINKLYSIKSDPINNTQKTLAKSLLNNLLGRFGINLEKPITKTISRKEFDNITLIHKIIY